MPGTKDVWIFIFGPQNRPGTMTIGSLTERVIRVSKLNRYKVSQKNDAGTLPGTLSSIEEYDCETAAMKYLREIDPDNDLPGDVLIEVSALGEKLCYPVSEVRKLAGLYEVELIPQKKARKQTSKKKARKQTPKKRILDLSRGSTANTLVAINIRKLVEKGLYSFSNLALAFAMDIGVKITTIRPVLEDANSRGLLGIYKYSLTGFDSIGVHTFVPVDLANPDEVLQAFRHPTSLHKFAR